MNRVILMGRLTRDPEVRYSQGERSMAIARYTLAVDRRGRARNQDGDQGQTADFINIVVWRKQAENVKNYLSQGSQVAIDGRIQTRSYDDNEGKKRYVTEVIADNVEFLGTKGSNASSGQNQQPSAEPTPYDFGNEKESNGTDISSNPFADFGSSIEISDDELPF